MTKKRNLWFNLHPSKENKHINKSLNINLGANQNIKDDVHQALTWINLNNLYILENRAWQKWIYIN